MIEQDTRQAPDGQFRIIGLDDPKDRGWKKGDYQTLSEAKQATPNGRGTMRFRIYDDQGDCVHGNGVQYAVG